MYKDREPTQCIKIGSRLNVLRLHVLGYGAESRVNVLGYVMHVLRYGAESRKPNQCIKIGNACIRIWSQKPSQCNKIGNACFKIWNAHFRHCATVFGTVRFFRKNSKIFGRARPRV